MVELCLDRECELFLVRLKQRPEARPPFLEMQHLPDFTPLAPLHPLEDQAGGSTGGDSSAGTKNGRRKCFSLSEMSVLGHF